MATQQFVQWQAQFDAAKTSLAELGISTNVDQLGNGDPRRTCKRGRHVWDYILDDENEEGYIDGPAEGNYPDDTSDTNVTDETGNWLAEQCPQLSIRTGLAPGALRDQIFDMLASNTTEDELQGRLIDLVGFEDFDFVIELLSRRSEVVKSAQSVSLYQTQTITINGHRYLSRAEREESLRQQDFNHKTAALRGVTMKEVEYPHVYKSYSAGNTISHGGQKYGLPLGSERREFEKYEEYYVPPGSTGKLAPGQKLVEIQELDGLCRRTFSGYKALNRMQSLVYPVAYRTNENMLICAPTGAVRGDVFSENKKRGANICIREKLMPQC